MVFSKLRIGVIVFVAVCLGAAACSGEGQPSPDASNKDAVDRSAPHPGEGGRDPALEARIEAVIEDFAANGPTTLENAQDRALVLYDWGNALSLSGEWIHPDLTTVVALITQPNFAKLNPKLRDGVLWAADNFIRDFSLRRERPDAFGDVSLRILKPATVNEHHSFEMTYTVGSQPIETGGGIVAPNHFRFSDFEYQTTDPTAPNYVTIRSSRPDATFVVDTFPTAGQYAKNLYNPADPRLFFRLSSGALQPGDQVTVAFGDMSGGSPGLKTVHYSNSALRHPIWVLTAPLAAGGVLHSLPEPAIPLLGCGATAAHGFGPAILAVKEEATFVLRTEDRFRNRAESGVPERYLISLNGAPYDEVDTHGEAVVRFTAGFDEPGVYRFSFASPDGAITGVAEPVLVEAAPQSRLYWGETHGHSGWAEGLGNVDAYFQFARDESRLDFITLSEHDLWMDLGEWADMKRAVDAYQEDGVFITFMGYEYTIDPPFGGHHNVLFRKPEEAVLASRQRHPQVDALYETLRAKAPIDDVLIAPHAHQPGDWTRSDRELERLVEIVSYHGTFEWFGRRYLDQGWEVGFIGSSDDHVGSPGYRPRAYGSPGSDNFGGIAAVYAPSLGRDSIFDNLRDRNAYATNGARIILKAAMDGVRMGRRLDPAASAHRATGRVVGTGEIASIDLLKNGDVVASRDFAADGGGGLIEIAFHASSDPNALRRSYRDATFIGAVDLGGLAVDGVSAPVAAALNSETEYARLAPAGGAIEFSLRSGGRINTIEIAPASAADLTGMLKIDLSGSDLARIEGAPRPVEFDVAALGAAPVVVPLDPQGVYTVSARRISPPASMERTFDIVDETPSEEGDYYYLRVRQRDGGMAWSSPWWVGAPKPKAALD